MERLKQKVNSANRALKTLQELLGSQSLTIVERDAGDRGCESFIPEFPIDKQTCGKR